MAEKACREQELREAGLPLAHGLLGETATPDWPPLMLEEVDRVLRGYPGAGGARRVLSHSPRPFSAASLVETPRGTVFVKRHAAAVRTAEGLEEEHRFSTHLLERGMETPAVLRDENGSSVTCEGAWVYEVHVPAAGEDVYREAQSWTPFLCSEHARAAGAAMARMHCAAESYSAPARSERSMVSSFSLFSAEDPVRAIAVFLESRPELRAYMEARDWPQAVARVLLPWHARLAPLLQHLPPLWTHNDLHASNLFWSGAGPEAAVTAVIDFGLADRTTAIHDVATAIERNCVDWLRLESGSGTGSGRAVYLDQVDALLRGYLAMRRLRREELLALPGLLPLVHAEFALMETDYFLRVLGSPEKAALAYEGYFLDHAAWFAAEEGRALLSYLAAELSAAAVKDGARNNVRA